MLGLKANGYKEDLRKESDAGDPPPHNNDGRYTKVGIGMVTDASGMKYFAVVFAG